MVLLDSTMKNGFGYRTTAEEVSKGIDASGLTAIVTGSTAGIGQETARVLALRGAHVYITGRSTESATAAKHTILKELPDAKLDILAPLDLSSQTSIRKAADSFLRLNQPLNLLINNAGVMASPFGLTKEGIELQFGTNHIGHFLLTNLLLDKLKETANKTGNESRIVNVSSNAMRLAYQPLDWDQISDKKKYSRVGAYGCSKLANLFHAQELTKRLKEGGVENVTANALHPGVIKTKLGRHVNILARVVYWISFPFWKNIPQGTGTTMFAALHPSLKGVSGKFFSNCNERDPTQLFKLAHDDGAAKKLWEVSTQLTST